jgi:hypothetical protein
MRNVRWQLTVLLAGLVAVTACTPMQLAPMRPTTDFADAASLDGLAMGPASLIANNSAGLIANNSAGLIANNSAGYRVAAVEEEVPLPRAVIYLTDARDDFFKDAQGRPLNTTTDASGRYEIPRGVPVNQPVIVSLILSENRREVGFTVPKAGRNTVNVSLATTYVTEFLRHSATMDGKTMAAYSLDKLTDLTERTNLAMTGGSLPQPTLKIADIAAMNMSYASVIGSNVQNLGDAWAQMLGRRVMAVTTFAGTGVGGTSANGAQATKANLDLPKGLAVDKQGNVFVAEENGHRVRRISPDGTIVTVAGNGQKGYSGDGGPATQAKLNQPRALAFDKHGNLIIADTLNMAIRVIPAVPGTYYGVTMPTPGNIYAIAGELDPAKFAANQLGNYPNGHSGNLGPARGAQLAGPRGLAFDSQGNLYFSDSYGWNTDESYHFIRKIDPSGTITTVLGQVTAGGVMSAGFSPDGTQASQVRLNYPQQLAIDGQDRLYIAEAGDHLDASTNRVRMIDLAALRSNLNPPIQTLAGGGDVIGDGAQGVATQIKRPYGVAVGKDGVIFISERGSEKIWVRMPDGTVRTLAGGGPLATDGDGKMLKFSQPHDLCLDANGDLLIAESESHKIRKVSTRFGL